jgi:hypothetical protein
VNGSFIICNTQTNEVEKKGFVNNDTEYQRASEQQQRSRSYNIALKMYGLVHRSVGNKDRHNNIQNMIEEDEGPETQELKQAVAYHQYQIASEQQQRSDDNRSNAEKMYHWFVV